MNIFDPYLYYNWILWIILVHYFGSYYWNIWADLIVLVISIWLCFHELEGCFLFQKWLFVSLSSHNTFPNDLLIRMSLLCHLAASKGQENSSLKIGYSHCLQSLHRRYVFRFFRAYLFLEFLIFAKFFTIDVYVVSIW